MRDWRRTIEALERKAADPACPAPEAVALRAKAHELRRSRCGGVTPIHAEALRVRRVLHTNSTGTTTRVMSDITVSFMGYGVNVPAAERTR